MNEDFLVPGGIADGAAEDIAASGQRIRPSVRRNGSTALPVQRHRYRVVTLAGALLAAAATVSSCSTSPAVSPPAGSQSGTSAAAPTAGGKQTKPAALSGPLTGVLSNIDMGGPGMARSVAFAPSGAILATGNTNGNVYLWNTVTGRLTATLTNSKSKGNNATDAGSTDSSGVTSVAYSPDGKILAAGSDPGNTSLWNTATDKLTATLTDPTTDGVAEGVTSVAFSPDGKTLAVSAGINIFLWNTATGKLTAALTDPDKGDVISSVAFSPDGTTLATCDGANARLWSTATDKLTATLTDPGANSPAGNGVGSVGFSPDGTTLATGDASGDVYLWDPATGKLTATLNGPSSGTGVVGANDMVSVAFAPDGTTLAGNGGGSTYLWETTTGKVTATLNDPTQDSPASLAFSPDGTALTVVDSNGNIYLWNIRRISS